MATACGVDLDHAVPQRHYFLLLVCCLPLHGCADVANCMVMCMMVADVLLPPLRAVLLRTDANFEARCRQIAAWRLRCTELLSIH